MAQLTLASLLKPITKDDALDGVLALLSRLGLQATSWQSGGIAITFAHGLAELVVQISNSIVPQLAASGFVFLASGAWLDLAADSSYDEQRDPATRAVRTVTLTSAASAPPYTIAPNQLWIETTDSTGRRFNSANSSPVTLGSGAVLPMAFNAESAGSRYNIADGTAVRLITSLPGVTATIGTGSKVTDGTDAETDASFQDKCRAKWPSLSGQMPVDAYGYWARKASSAVNRYYVDASNPDGPGTLRVYLAGPTGTVGGGVISAVDAVLQQRKGLGASVQTLSCTSATIAVTGTVYVSGVSPTAAKATAETVLDAMLANVAIGGDVIGSFRGVTQDAIIERLRGRDETGTPYVPGVVRVALTSGDFSLVVPQVPTLDLSGLTFTAI